MKSKKFSLKVVTILLATVMSFGFAACNGGSYGITVSGGTADKTTAAKGDVVTITANAAPSGLLFDKWTSSDGVTFADPSQATTTFTMPGKKVTVKVNYKMDDYFLTNPLTASNDAYYSRFTDSWRSVKQEGWAINKTLLQAGNEAKLARALKVFDYLYSKAGNQVMSYGPDAWIDGTIEYGGRTVPKLSAAALNELQMLEGGNYTNYYRTWLGGTYPVGYVKEQGMEYQTVHAKGKTGLDNYMKAIELGTVDHSQVSSGGAGFNYQDLATPALTTTANVELKMAVLYNALRITYVSGDFKNVEGLCTSTEFSPADGQKYNIGDLKPVWKYLGQQLNVTFKDAALSNATKVSDNFTKMVENNNYATYKDNFDVITGGATNIVKHGVGEDGVFVDLIKHLDKMPNFKAFLNANPFIKALCTAGDGAMYYAPYFDGYDDLERMLMMRTDWVEKLLDGATAPSLDVVASIPETSYTAFNPESLNKSLTIVKADGSGTQEITKNYSKNIVTIQNELAVKSGKNLTEALRNYIDTTYNNYYGNQRSKLFTGVNAAYDADELIALLRCVKTNPYLLTGDAATTIVPYYPRNHTADRIMDLYRLMEIWGVRGLDSRNNFMFVGEDGKVHDSRLEPKTLAGLEKLNQLYKEGLILENFDNTASVSASTYYPKDNTFRGRLNKQNRGFMTNDYNQTTTVVNSLGDGATPEISGFYLTPVLPPFTDWGFKSKPALTNPVFRSVPTAFPFDDQTQEAVNQYTLVGTTTASLFFIDSGNGGTGVSNIAWSDLIMKGYGQDFTKGAYTYNFASKSAFINQVRNDWKGQNNLNMYDLAYQAWYNTHFGA